MNQQLSSDDKVVFQVKCADCDCFPEECKNSPSVKECPNCSWYECCCWATIKEKGKKAKEVLDSKLYFQITH